MWTTSPGDGGEPAMGTLSFDRQPLARLSVFRHWRVVMAGESAARPFGRRRARGARFLPDAKTAQYFAREAAREAIAIADAVEAPAGETTVVLGPDGRAFCCMKRSDTASKPTSTARAFRRSPDASAESRHELCTVVDDGNIASRRGSLNVDDEGIHAAQRMIENGVLRGYLQDKLSSRLMGSESTGSGRRESYAHILCRA